MNVNEIANRVAEINTLRGDDERAHIAEDNLHIDVLNAIAMGSCSDAEACAKAALETLKIDFTRWCA